MTKSKYAQPLPDRLEAAAIKVYQIHQSGAKNRGDQIEKVVIETTKNQDERDMIFYRAQRLQLDGLPEVGKGKAGKPPRTPVESSEPSSRSHHAATNGKTKPAKPQTRQSSGHKSVKPTPAKKPEKMPF